MINNTYEIGRGRKLVNAMLSGKIRKENRPNHGNIFTGGYEQFYFNKFQSYLGTTSRFLMNKKMEERVYDGE